MRTRFTRIWYDDGSKHFIRIKEAMISYGVYRLIHFVGIMFLFLALGGLALHAANGGTKTTNRARALVAATHGIALFIILLGGFGMLARLGIAHTGFPGWVWAKFGIWLVLGALFMLPYRFPGFARPLWVILPLLGATAAYMALFKPF
jgi:hypothetical protein